MDQMSPSKLGTFLDCPAKYDYKYNQKLPDPGGPAALRGTMVHDALELLFDSPPEERTLVRALQCMDMVKDDYLTVDWDEAARLIRNLYSLEDPTTVNAVATELDWLHDVSDNGRKWRGIVDRIDGNGTEVIILDYKTGKAPASKYIDEKALGIRWYGTVAQALGYVPSKLVLLYLGTPARIELPFNETVAQSMRLKVNAVWDVIEMNEQSGTWNPTPSYGCSWCPYKEICPEGLDNQHKRR